MIANASLNGIGYWEMSICGLSKQTFMTTAHLMIGANCSAAKTAVSLSFVGHRHTDTQTRPACWSHMTHLKGSGASFATCRCCEEYALTHPSLPPSPAIDSPAHPPSPPQGTVQHHAFLHPPLPPAPCLPPHRQYPIHSSNWYLQA